MGPGVFDGVRTWAAWRRSHDQRCTVRRYEASRRAHGAFLNERPNRSPSRRCPIGWMTTRSQRKAPGTFPRRYARLPAGSPAVRRAQNRSSSVASNGHRSPRRKDWRRPPSCAQAYAKGQGRGDLEQVAPSTSAIPALDPHGARLTGIGGGGRVTRSHVGFVP